MPKDSASRDRFTSIIDQAIASLVNFLHVWVVARATSESILGQYVLLVGVSLLAIRIHAAQVTMPLAVALGSAPSAGTAARFASLHARTMSVIAVATLPIVVIVLVLASIQVSPTSVLAPALGIAGLVNQEYLRRLLLNSGQFLANVTVNLVFSVLLLTGVALSSRSAADGAIVFVGYVPAALASLIAVSLMSGSRLVAGATHREWIENGITQAPLLVNNLAQWGSGHGVYYLAGGMLGLPSVATLAVLRNLFAPFHIALLALEGYLPRMFGGALKHGGPAGLALRTFRELKLLLAFVPIAIGLLAFDGPILQAVYGGSYESRITPYMLLGFLAIYALAYASRVLLIALRAANRLVGAGSASIAGLVVVLCGCVVLGGALELHGIISAMVLSEFTILVLLRSRFADMMATR